MIEDSCGTHLSGDQATHETVVARSPDFRRKDLVLFGVPVLFESMVGVALQWVGRCNEGVASDPWEKKNLRNDMVRGVARWGHQSTQASTTSPSPSLSLS